MRLYRHLTGNGPAPLLAAGVMAAAIALSAGSEAVAATPVPQQETATNTVVSAGTPDRRA
ncbi:hypothetical protein [Actinoplanes aureus]|uniref:Uncharacterized protein n=1 Tax=Actinoplanes aureus TaxID=2792083 RepID=A0A931C481_9ACTN|nr:hypothetical protein [Actinoplanes aureus]MBG0560287.1 hypothetical protein [Actinoplanes aureus]